MFKKFLGVFKQGDPSSSKGERDDITLGAVCPLPPPASKVEKPFVENRKRPRLVRHTPSLRSGTKFFMNDGDGYFNIDNPTERMSYEEAQRLSAMPIVEPDAVKEVVPTTKLEIWEQRRTGQMPAYTG